MCKTVACPTALVGLSPIFPPDKRKCDHFCSYRDVPRFCSTAVLGTLRDVAFPPLYNLSTRRRECPYFMANQAGHTGFRGHDDRSNIVPPDAWTRGPCTSCFRGHSRDFGCVQPRIRPVQLATLILKEQYITCPFWNAINGRWFSRLKIFTLSLMYHPIWRSGSPAIDYFISADVLEDPTLTTRLPEETAYTEQVRYTICCQASSQRHTYAFSEESRYSVERRQTLKVRRVSGVHRTEEFSDNSAGQMVEYSQPNDPRQAKCRVVTYSLELRRVWISRSM